MMVSKLITLWRLGLHNLLWVATYRLALKLGLVTRNMRIGTYIKGPFFNGVSIDKDSDLESVDVSVFGWINYSKDQLPNWHQAVISHKQAKEKNTHWSKISDFDLDVGDIKSVWELSRFDWVLYFSVEYLRTGEEKYLDTLNAWLESWFTQNPVNQGVNWKCGQEASIRVMHLCLACVLLDQHKSLSFSLIKVLEQHLSRISPTVLYAMAQDNNHGTSEAVALFIGGTILENNGSSKKALKWKKQGLFWLENRIRRLISDDGSFSQHSVNYHRVLLDSLCVAELVRSKFELPEFSPELHRKLELAISWLACFTEPETGDTPNLGANDGARIIPLSSANFRDYRPTVQLASALFLKKRYYNFIGPHEQPLKLLKLKIEDSCSDNISYKVFDKGGYVYLKELTARCYMRYPVFKFRPSQSDVFHVDFWLGKNNILRDAGTYSYNCDREWLEYFPSVAAHNTVQFDEADQMPRLSRFLYSDWLKVSNVKASKRSDRGEFSASYSSNTGQHQRNIQLSATELIITDKISGFKKSAVLRWRLIPNEYDIVNNSIITNDFILSITSSSEISRFEIVEGWESRFYLKKTTLPVLEVEVGQASVITTLITWNTK